ncbi:alpha/beta hydrolase family protein [Ceratobasidium sp. AG-Ba]|nr:alpha/beta hydrolase family protein [Ceratobasidium sp. AG-Ba]
MSVPARVSPLARSLAGSSSRHVLPTTKTFAAISASRSIGATKRGISSNVGGKRPASHAAVATNRPDPRFPCVDAHAARELRVAPQPTSDPSSSGPEPAYGRPKPTSYHKFHSTEPLPLVYGDVLPEFEIAYETWGQLNEARDNAILLHTGLSASSHAASTAVNPADGWWEKFIGPGKAIDTNRYFVICTNVLGGCYGSTGPSSPDPLRGGAPYAAHFPILSILDMVRAQYKLLDHLGIEKLYASVGSSMGAMSSLATAWVHPERVGRIVSISGTARSSPGSIAMRYAQRSVLMADPNWNNGSYYEGSPPHTGMKLARQIATITYRSGPEWDQRFGRNLRKLSPGEQTQVEMTGGIRRPALCPDFLIETYLDHQGEQFCLKYDANSFLYISKAMDLFDMTETNLRSLSVPFPAVPASSLESAGSVSPQKLAKTPLHLSPPPSYLSDLSAGLAPLSQTPTLVLGVQSDILFPVEQQREMADALRMAGNGSVVYYELGGVWGHDTFLIDVMNVGGAIRGFLA